MRLSDVIALGKECLIWGAMAAAFLGIVVLIGYGLIYKKLLKGQGKMKPGKFALYALFSIYMLVLFSVTTLRYRGAYIGSNTQFHLFYAYREAWNSFSGIHWRQIILNILMCVPLGFLLPLLSARLCAWWKSCLLGAGVVLLIELIQFVSKRGICDVDDIFNNMLGVMIGYGCYEIWNLLICCVKSYRKKQKKNLCHVFLCQLPLFMTIVGFAVIFMMYANQELGNLKSQYIYQRKNVTVASDISYSDEEKEVPVYQAHISDADEAKEFAEEFFEMLGTEIDESSADIYDETAIYRNNEGNSLAVDYIGNVYSYTDFDALFGEDEVEMNAKASEEEIRDALEAFRVGIPEEAVFENSGVGNYAFYVDKILIDDLLYDGNIMCRYTENQVISDFSNRMIAYEPYKDFAIISEKEAFEKLQNGKFNWGNSDAMEMEVNGVALDYETDSKGFYQPVYAFEVEIAGEEYTINIPAIK